MRAAMRCETMMRKGGTMNTPTRKTYVHPRPNRSRSTIPPTALVENQPTAPTVQWQKGWTPWGTPCGVMVVDGFAYAAHANEQQNCPLARLANV